MNDQMQLTEEKVTECREMFEYFDKDKDGTISINELGNVMRSLGANPTQSNLQEMINEIDQDGCGKIEFRDFLHLFANKLNEPETEEDLLEVFKIFDMDGNGNISAQELKHVLTTLGEKLTEDEVDTMLMEADSNGDGTINYKEFVSLMMSK